jgi:dTDP-4-dehydrorhamnose 3,5-epimerase/CDP-3, 6-dideoxy-D-glycero-D-glycero-4-hexulose-5-epimerase
VEFYDTNIQGVKIIKCNLFKDDRGVFCKTFNEELFKQVEINMAIKESYYSISKKDVIRGMHFQSKPYEHEKLVYVANGKILDVVLDIRKDSPTYKKYLTIELTDDNGVIVFIPKGCAHGFKSLIDNTMVVYNVSTVYSAKHDKGIHYNSFGFDWEIKEPILSSRDLSFKDLDDIDLILTE